MWYMGGKSKNGKKIAEYLESQRDKNSIYFEPFCGSCAVGKHLKDKRIFSDFNPYLISLWNAVVHDNWVPPDFVDEETYQARKLLIGKPEEIGFCGVTSFGGKWFRGYPRNKEGSSYYFLGSKKSLLKDRLLLLKAEFKHSSYHLLEIPDGSLVYCDPPYRGTTDYFCAFNHFFFWKWVRKLSQRCIVYISEKTAPRDFEAVLTFEKDDSLRNKRRKPMTEYLWRYKG